MRCKHHKFKIAAFNVSYFIFMLIYSFLLFQNRRAHGDMSMKKVCKKLNCIITVNVRDNPCTDLYHFPIKIKTKVELSLIISYVSYYIKPTPKHRNEHKINQNIQLCIEIKNIKHLYFFYKRLIRRNTFFHF